ncbi:MAG: glycosyltransferase, partial [Campylobacterales bacterium]|nr:glycosyltransferase [Campylobacterales bacterium]
IENSLYFGNLPPLQRVNNSMVYLHNQYLLMSTNVLANSSVRFFIKYLLQQLYIKYFIKNVDFVACQNENIKQQFINKYNFDKVELFPFYRLCDKGLLYNTPKLYDFCYVSLAHPHKNHLNLIEACDLLSQINVPFRLALTIEDGQETILEKINQVNQKGVVNIVNLGLLSKQDVCKLYAQSKCLVFPSTQETFGLALVEAANMGLDVVASDLDYVYQSVKPSLVFNPNSSLDIAEKLKMYLKGNIKKSEAIINNEIDKMIKFLMKEKQCLKTKHCLSLAGRVHLEMRYCAVF